MKIPFKRYWISIEEQNLPSQNVSFWHEDCFILNIFKKQVRKLFLFYLSVNYLKYLDQKSVPEKEHHRYHYR